MGEVNEAVRGINDLRAVGTQMTGYDAATWRAAAGDRNMRSSILAISLLDSAPDWERLRARFDRLTRLVPLLRERPLFGAVGVSTPRLAVDPDFDLDIHLHRYSMPEGSEWSDVLEEARRISLTDFDHDRPLWEAILIEGLPEGRAALLLKLHHAIADGQATVLVAANLFELTPQGNPQEPVAPAPPVGEAVSVTKVSRADIHDNVARMLGFATSGVKIAAKFAIGTLRDPVSTWTEALEMVESIGRFTSVPEAVMSPIMTGRCTTYHFAAFSFPFAGMKAAAKEHKSTVNDVFLAAVCTGAAKYHDRHGSPAPLLRFNIPISLRSVAKDGNASNAVTIARFPLPVSNATVEARLQAAHAEVRRWRDEPALTLSNPLADVSWLLPVPVIATAARHSDITTSNVPGPPIPLYIAGAKIIGMWPLVATIGAAANVTMVTYDGSAFVGISADDEAIPDIAEFVEDLRAGFEELIGSAVGSADVLRHGDKAPEEKAPIAQAPAKKASARKAPAKKASARKTAAKKPEAAKPEAAEAPAKKAPAPKASAKKASTRKAPAKKAAAKPEETPKSE